MIKWTKYNVGAFLLIIFMTSNSALANKYFKIHLEKEIDKTFDVDDDIILGVHNKYGDINIATWSKNKVEVNAYVKVKTNSESKGQTFLDGINIEFSQSKSKLGMKTVYPDQDNSSWWGSWWNNSDNIDFEVHYTIKAPKDISTNLINKHGSIHQTNISGSCTVTNKYGDIILEKVGGDLSLDLGYGKTVVGQAADISVDIKNSTFTIGECQNVVLNSKYCDFTFSSCGNMDIDSKYDEFTIGSAKNIKNDGKHDQFKIGEAESVAFDTKSSTIKIDMLLHKCFVDTKYGSIYIKSTGSYMEEIDIKSKYTDYSFGIDSDFQLKYIGDHADLSINVPHEKYDSNDPRF